MDKTIDCYFTPASPYAYMGGPRLVRITADAGATVAYKPVDYGRIFPASGGLALIKRAAQRRAYRMMELRRWKAFLGLSMNLEPKHFPVADWPAAGMIVAARRRGLDCGPLSNALMRAVWEEERDIADQATLAAIADALGMDGASLLDAVATDKVMAAFEADTDEALARGVFGAPTYVLGNELFWGQDRLDFLERALADG